MATDTLAGNWTQVRGEVKERWGQLTDDDMLQIEGKRDKLVGTLQEKYGYTKMRAEEDVKTFMDQFNDKSRARQMITDIDVNKILSQYPVKAILAGLGGLLLLAFLIRAMRGS